MEGRWKLNSSTAGNQYIYVTTERMPDLPIRSLLVTNEGDKEVRISARWDVSGDEVIETHTLGPEQSVVVYAELWLRVDLTQGSEAHGTFVPLP